MHILPDLKKIEEKFTVKDGAVIIGVHSAKFANEKDSANILSAVQRYDITHPVINDVNSTMWNRLNIQCWPTLLILGPRGNPIFVLMGEGKYDLLDSFLTVAMKYYKSNNSLKNHLLPLNPSTDLMAPTCLKFPGKIVCSKTSLDENKAELYAMSDSGNHRILIFNPSGTVVQKIGGKTSGFVDGDFKKARFNGPQGLAFLSSDVLYVADTENHAIRKIDFKTKIVETIAGTGKQGNDRIGGKLGKLQVISSPWDILVYKTKDMDMSFNMDESTIPDKVILIIAMAGSHQIWGIFLEDTIWWKFKKYMAGTCAAIAGNGNEENRNNSYAHNAAFAQPSGLALNRQEKCVYIADSESSSIRKLSLKDGKVSAVAGGDRNPSNLFAFGDKDGESFNAKFQHPIGVTFNDKDNFIYVADTYNHKIKKINPVNGAVTTCQVVDGANNDFQLNEPGGLVFNPSGDFLYITDTNNHSIEIVDVSTMKRKTLSMIFDSTPKTNELGKVLKFGLLKIKPQGGKIKLSLTLSPEKDVHLTEEAPQKWNVFLPNEHWYIDHQNGLYKTEPVELDVTVPAVVDSQKVESLIVSFKLNLCMNNICFPRVFSILFPMKYDEEGLDCIIEEANIKVFENDIRFQ